MKLSHISKISHHFPNGNLVDTVIYNDYSIEMHTHEFYEINIILNGTGCHCIEDKKLLVNTGDVFIIPPYMTHAYTETKELNVFHLLIHPRLIEEIYDEARHVQGFVTLFDVEPVIRTNGNRKLLLQLKPEDMYHLLKDLEPLQSGGRLYYENAQYIRKHTAIKVLYDLSHKLWLQINSKKEQKRGNLIVPSIEYINHCFTEKLSIDFLAEYCNVSRATYQRHFKELTGISPGQYILNLRVEKAKALILSGVKASHAAQEAGFFDASHLEKYLKREAEK